MMTTATQAFAHNLQAQAAMTTFAFIAPQAEAPHATRKAAAPVPGNN